MRFVPMRFTVLSLLTVWLASSSLSGCGAGGSPEGGADVAAAASGEDGGVAASGEDGGVAASGPDVAAPAPGEDTAVSMPGEDTAAIPGRDAGGEPPAPGEVRYFVAGGLLTHSGGLMQRTGALEGECPFPADSAPCLSEACQADPDSAACEEVVQAWCAEHPEHVACGEGQGPGPGECALSPDAYPCHLSVCDDWEAPACKLAVYHYCHHEVDAACTPGMDVCPFAPNEEPCGDERCFAPDSPECAAYLGSWCEAHPENLGCGGWGEGYGPGGPIVATFTPTGVWMKVYEVALSEDAEGCTNPVVVGGSATPEWADFSQNPTLITADPPTPGVYPCVIITIAAAVRWEAAEESACPGVQVCELQGAFPEPVDFESTPITIYVSTAGTEFGQNGHGFSPPGLRLAEPHVAGPDVVASTFYADVTGKGDLRESGACDMEAPVFGFTTHYAPRGAANPLAPPADCSPDQEIHAIDSWGEPCIHRPCGIDPAVDGWLPLDGSFWSHKEYVNGPGDTCDAFCITQMCPDQHGGWMSAMCFPECP